MIRVKDNLKSTECDLWKEPQEFIGHIKNEVQFHDVRVQIMREKAVGYFVFWKGYKIPIDTDGRIATWPDGFYDQIDNLLNELI